MTEREPNAHPLHPELTLAGLMAALPNWVRPDSDREDWVEVLRERLPAAMAAQLLLPLVRAGELRPDGRALLPRADWEWLCERLLTQARAVLESRDALLQAEAGPPLDELAWSPHVEDWRAMDLGVVTPHLAGRVVSPRPGEPDAFGPRPLIALGPGEAWARLLDGWVSLGQQDDTVTVEELRRPFPPRPMDPAETEARLADLQRRIERQVADLVPPSRNSPSAGFILEPLDDLSRPDRDGKGGHREPGEGAARSDLSRTGEALTSAERLMVRVHRIFGDEVPFWLLRRNLWLERERPIDLFANETDRERLADHLSALEAGVYL
ncbi:hypothetical protein Rumeso_04057 [Rubellimicrobium mesophilum DSM 19309]|uniref:Uncharacterized protein n=1 Tax=Rubellimicrobium mesophilum DSM 19309 TaxID=442562 RepID=A0A017HIP0_9RHOB|nr:hypothetical protein [Rubellimicrobium mesophilum]EYD74372.1 hypothetical protein Rumeso_04057 [Rubellimicrobium mesophilum DSM 19309]